MPSIPGTINFPTAPDDSISLIELRNNASSTLNIAIDNDDLLISVADPGEFPDTGFITILDNLFAPTKMEIAIYTSKSGNNLIVPVGGRGAQGTIPQSFSPGAIVEQRYTARHHTAFADLLIGLEAKLGIGTDTPGGGAEALISDAASASAWRAITQADVSGLGAALAGKQPLDADLTGIAALSADGLPRKTAGTWAMDSATSGTVSTGTANKLAYYPGAGAIVDDLADLEWNAGADRLNLDGNLWAKKHGAIGAQSAINGGSLGNPFGGTSPAAVVLDIEEAISGDFSVGSGEGGLISIEFDPTANNSSVNGLTVVASVKDENPQEGLAVSGLNFIALHRGSGDGASIVGVNGITGNGNAGITNSLMGGQFINFNFGAGGCERSVSVSAVMQNFTTVTEHIGFHARSPDNIGGSIGEAYGVLVDDHNAATSNWAIKTGLGKVEFGDRLFAAAPDSAPADAALANSAFSAYLDESGNKLKFKVKYSGGSVKTGEIALV